VVLDVDHTHAVIAELRNVEPLAFEIDCEVIDAAADITQRDLVLQFKRGRIRSSGNLDPELSLEIMKLFKRFNEVGVTVVIATHDVHLIEHFAARRIVLGDGRVTDAGMPAVSLPGRPEPLRAL